MLRTRLLTALVALPILILLLAYGPEWLNLIFFTAVAAIANVEYYNMAFPSDTWAGRLGAVLGTAVFLLWGIGILSDVSVHFFAFPLLLAFISMFFFFLFRTGEMQTAAGRVALGLFGFIYVDLLAIYFLAVLVLPNGWRFLVLLIAIVFLNDTGGYFAGRGIGGPKFYEKVSPKKTWAGSVGGALAGVLGVFLFDWILDLDMGAVQIVLLALATGYIGQLGDLCESLLKRSFGVKDSGGIIPGHGGILDRIDALLFAAPVFYYFLIVFVL